MLSKHVRFDHLLAFDQGNVFFKEQDKANNEEARVYNSTEVGKLLARELDDDLPLAKYQKIFYQNEVKKIRSAELITDEFLSSLGIEIARHRFDIREAFLKDSKRKKYNFEIPKYLHGDTRGYNGTANDFDNFKAFVLGEMAEKGFDERKMSEIAMDTAGNQSLPQEDDDFLLALLKANTSGYAQEVLRDVANNLEATGLVTLIRLVQQFGRDTVRSRIQEIDRIAKLNLLSTSKEQGAAEMKLLKEMVEENLATPELVCASKLLQRLNNSDKNMKLKGTIENLSLNELTFDFLLEATQEAEWDQDRVGEMAETSPKQIVDETQVESTNEEPSQPPSNASNRKKFFSVKGLLKRFAEYAEEIEPDDFAEKIQETVMQRVAPLPDDIEEKKREVVDAVNSGEVFKDSIGGVSFTFDATTPIEDIREYAIRSKTGDAAKEEIVEEVWNELKGEVEGKYEGKPYLVRLGAIAVAKETLKSLARGSVNAAILGLPIEIPRKAEARTSQPHSTDTTGNSNQHGRTVKSSPQSK